VTRATILLRLSLIVGTAAKLKFLQESEKTDVQCKASLNRRLLLAVVLVGGDAEETKNLQC
jgi:hypothetical protein